jgi:predicted MPP superfamily phosphohydrolase
MTVRATNILLLALAVVLLIVVYAVETVIPQVTVTRIESPSLASFFSGRVMVQITDMHTDLIIMTGDYVESNTDFDQLDRFLADIDKIAPTIASLGNNDYCCKERVEKAFAKTGIMLLENQTAVLTDGSDSVYVVGLEDNFLWHDDYFAATEGVPPGAPRIVLGHAPAIAEKIDPDGVQLILSGHLHGGQIDVPFYGPLARNTVCFATRMYTAGLYHVDGMNLYSNRGIGTSVIPLRFLARPEVAVLDFVE